MTRKRRLAWIYGACIAVLLMMMALSLKTGVIQVEWADILHALTRFEPDNLKHLAIADSRLIRTLSSVLVGAALAAAGAITQGISRNDMADSGIIGLSAGASLSISVCLALGVASYAVVVFSGILGSFLTLLLVMTITALVKQGSVALRMILSGAMVTMFLSALSQTVAIYTGREQNLLFWTLGDISGASAMKLTYCGPVILAGLLAALLLSRHITVLATSDVRAVLGHLRAHPGCAHHEHELRPDLWRGAARAGAVRGGT